MGTRSVSSDSVDSDNYESEGSYKSHTKGKHKVRGAGGRRLKTGGGLKKRVNNSLAANSLSVRMANAFRQKIAIAVAAAQAKKNQTDSTPQSETNFWYQKKPSIINVEMKALAEKSN